MNFLRVSQCAKNTRTSISATSNHVNSSSALLYTVGMDLYSFLNKSIDFQPLAIEPTPFEVDKMARKLGVRLTKSDSTPVEGPSFTNHLNRSVISSNGYVARRFFGMSEQDLRDAVKIQKFCEANGFRFFGNITGKNPEPQSALKMSSFHHIAHGFIIDLGEDAWIEIGQLNPERYRLGDEAYDVSEQPNTDIVPTSFTYVRINSPGFESPHLLIDAIVYGSRKKIIGSRLRKLSLEGTEFQKYFAVYGENINSDALTFLDPKLMASLIDRFADIDSEFSPGHAFALLDARDYTTKGGMSDLLTIADILMSFMTRHTRQGTTTTARYVPNSVHMLTTQQEQDRVRNYMKQNLVYVLWGILGTVIIILIMLAVQWVNS